MIMIMYQHTQMRSQMTLLKTADEVTAAANKAKKEVALKGTNGNEDALRETIFCGSHPDGWGKE